MTSQINANNIDGTYPVAGQPNNTQGMRDNFTATKTNFQYASDEITELQSKSVLKSALAGSTLDNNMNDNLLYAVKMQDVSYTEVQLTATSGTVTLDYAAGMYQAMPSVTGNVSLAFTNWPASGTVGVLRFAIVVTNTAYTLTLPASVSVGLATIDGISPGTAGVSNTITFAGTGVYAFEFLTANGGTTVSIQSLMRPTNTQSNEVYITNTSASTSTTTGALIVTGGVGVGANLNVGGDFATYNTSNSVVFSANATTGFVKVNAPVVPANSVGAVNIVGSTDGYIRESVQAGTMLHITGNDGVGARLFIDTAGAGASVYSGIISRRSRGTASSPTAVQSGDTLSRHAGAGWGTTKYALTSSNISPTRIDLVATETYTDTAAGSKIEMYTATNGSNTQVLSANITSTLTTVPALSATGNIVGGNVSTAGLISATGNITGGNVSTGILSLSGNVISALNVTGNITGANVTTTGLMSTTGNVNAGNIIGTALMTCVGNITGGNLATAGILTVTGNVSTTGNLLLTDGGGTMGYNTGAGGTVAQSGNKSAGVTLNKPSGEITMQNTALANNATVTFVLTNSTISARDVLIINLVGGGTSGAYTFGANCIAGSATIAVTNRSGGSLSEGIVLRYVVIRGSIA